MIFFQTSLVLVTLPPTFISALTFSSYFLFERLFPCRLTNKKPSVWDTPFQLLARDILETLKIMAGSCHCSWLLQSLMVRPYCNRHTLVTEHAKMVSILTRKSILTSFLLASFHSIRRCYVGCRKEAASSPVLPSSDPCELQQ